MGNMKQKRIFSGIIFIVAAIILLVGKLGYFGEVNIWSLVFTVFFIAVIIKSIRPIHFGGILFPIAFLCIIYSKKFGIESITPGTVLAVALFGTIGLSMIFHKQRRYYYGKDKEIDFQLVDNENESNVVQKTTFGQTAKYINSDDFKQADLECSFGSMQIYFDKAKVKNGKAVVNICASFSGIELFVPKEWNVEDNILTSFGGIDYKNHSIPTGETKLVLIGEASFSVITIIYV